MTELHERRYIQCPAVQAPQYLEQWFERSAKAGSALVALRAPIRVPGLPPMELSRDCVIEVARRATPGSFTTRYCVQWKAAGNGPYPRFDGSLTVCDDEDYDRSLLLLDGAYDPPLGVGGAPFDAIIGHRIAESTGQELLDRIGRYIEQTYRGAEAVKRNKRQTERCE